MDCKIFLYLWLALNVLVFLYAWLDTVYYEYDVPRIFKRVLEAFTEEE